MLYDELSPYHHNLPKPLPHVFVFGWLSANSEFQKGHVSEAVKEKLCRLAKEFPVALERGITWCPLCNVEVQTPDNQLLGIAEVWIPTNEGYFVAPDLVIHYIYRHEYRPPDVVALGIDKLNVAVVGPTLNSRRKQLVTELFKS